ncbi:MAG: MFS transporter [Prevotella sp.]|jgi:predicted MFS family arabinose efflux permease
MLKKLVPNQGIPRPLLWVFAIVSGVAVANLYYSQPLLNMISDDLQVSPFVANLIPMFSQIGYAVGLLFIIPLGDLYSKRKIIFICLSVLVASLLMLSLSKQMHLILFMAAIVGTCSVMPHVFIPIASQYSKPERKTQNMGILLSGLLTGILASRVVSGIVGQHFGWRVMYGVAAVLMLLCILLIWRVLPDMEVNFKGTYWQLMKTVFTLVRDNRTLRVVSIRAALCFGSLFCLWSTLAFKMSGAPFYANNDVIGLLGLCGIAGALTASVIGKYIHRYGTRCFHLLGCALMILAWMLMYVFQYSYIGLIVGIIVVDAGMQCVQLSNQSCALALMPKATNRINTIFMTTFFFGGALGTFLSGICWNLYGWGGVVVCSLVLAGLSLSMTVFSKD